MPILWGNILENIGKLCYLRKIISGVIFLLILEDNRGRLKESVESRLKFKASIFFHYRFEITEANIINMNANPFILAVIILTLTIPSAHCGTIKKPLPKPSKPLPPP